MPGQKGANEGVATSPVIDVTALGGAAYVSFDLNRETDLYLSQDETLDHFSATVTNNFGESLNIDFGDNTMPLSSTYLCFFHSGPPRRQFPLKQAFDELKFRSDRVAAVEFGLASV